MGKRIKLGRPSHATVIGYLALFCLGPIEDVRAIALRVRRLGVIDEMGNTPELQRGR